MSDVPNFDWTKVIYLEDSPSQDVKNIYANNGKFIGEAVLDVDGTWGYWTKVDGAWTDSILLCLGAMLYEMNKPMYDEWENYFESSSQE